MPEITYLRLSREEMMRYRLWLRCHKRMFHKRRYPLARIIWRRPDELFPARPPPPSTRITVFQRTDPKGYGTSL